MDVEQMGRLLEVLQGIREAIQDHRDAANVRAALTFERFDELAGVLATHLGLELRPRRVPPAQPAGEGD